MDPDVAYHTAIDNDAYASERRNAARGLLTWLYGGGFMPADWAGTRAELCDMLRGIRDSITPSPPPERFPFDPQPNR